MPDDPRCPFIVTTDDATSYCSLAASAGPPPTNGPTREDLAAVLGDALDAWASLSDAEMAEHLDDWGQTGYLADAVLPLLASHRPDNDPEPTNDRDEAMHAEAYEHWKADQ